MRAIVKESIIQKIGKTELDNNLMAKKKNAFNCMLWRFKLALLETNNSTVFVRVRVQHAEGEKTVVTIKKKLKFRHLQGR
jgi:hypothetical protein